MSNPRIKNAYKFEYFINEKGDAVTCKIALEWFDLDTKLKETINHVRKITNRTKIAGYDLYATMENPMKIIGTARLKDGDISDIEFAKKIARAKALRKANKIMANIVEECSDILRDESYRLLAYAAGTSYRAELYDREISDLLSR